MAFLQAPKRQSLLYHKAQGILVYIFVFSPNPARAASELETCCTTDGASWDYVISTCTIPEPSPGGGGISVRTELTILLGETIDNYSTIEVCGIVNNGGTIENNGEEEAAYGLEQCASDDEGLVDRAHEAAEKGSSEPGSVAEQGGSQQAHDEIGYGVDDDGIKSQGDEFYFLCFHEWSPLEINRTLTSADFH